MKKIIIFLAMSLVPIFTFPQHIKNFLNCGLIKVDDYVCFKSDTIFPSKNPYQIPKSKFYNQFAPTKSQMKYIKVLKTTAFLVIKDDSLIYEYYAPNYDSSSIFNSFSMAKTITSLLIGIAIDNGFIKSVDEPVNQYLNLSGKYAEQLRIEDLLNMASGLNWSENFFNPWSHIAKAYYDADYNKLLTTIKVSKRPNRRWHYQCGNFLLAGMIIEKASNMKLKDFTYKYLWEPLGAEHFALWAKNPQTNIIKSFCCFYATARDFAKLGLLFLHNGQLNGQQIISASYLQKMQQPANWLKFGLFRKVNFYRLGLWTYPLDDYKAYFFAGVLGQYIFILPEENVVIVRLGNLVNQLRVKRLPPDVRFYLKVGTQIARKWEENALKAGKANCSKFIYEFCAILPKIGR